MNYEEYIVRQAMGELGENAPSELQKNDSPKSHVMALLESINLKHILIAAGAVFVLYLVYRYLANKGIAIDNKKKYKKTMHVTNDIIDELKNKDEFQGLKKFDDDVIEQGAKEFDE